MLGSLVLAGIGCALMSNPRRKRKTHRNSKRRVSRKRKGHSVSPGGAASRLAHWRWHHNPRVAKTKLVYVIQGNYGYGWDDENEEDNKVDARRSIKEYRENGPGSYRLIRRRVKVEGNPRKRRRK